MKNTYLKKWSFCLGIALVAQVFSFSNAYSAASNCQAEKIEFKKLYLELQGQFLNYEGKDTKVDAKGNLTLTKHDPTKPYEGRVFEDAIFKEYQNSLKKVARLYQAAKFDKDADDLKKSTPGLVEFLKAIDEGDQTNYIKNNKINDVINSLADASKKKFANGDKKFVLTDNDQYLLKKLLTHAQDRICSVEMFEKTGKKTKNFTAEELGLIRNAPLNRIISAIKGAKIGADSELLVDETTAISSAMAEHMQKLSDWMKKNKECQKAIANPSFIQPNIQGCNYNKLLDVLNQDNLDQVQAVLHFINANERFLNRAQTKAETAMDELKLESMIDGTFKNLGNKVTCSKVTDAKNNKKRLFVRNLPYKDNKFDTSKIACRLKDRELKPSECAQKIELVSDELGRGLELKQKEKSGPAITFSIIDNPDCVDLQPSSPILSGVLDQKRNGIIGTRGTTVTTVTDPSGTTTTTVVTTPDQTPSAPLKSLGACISEGQKDSPGKILVPSMTDGKVDGKSCVVPDANSCKGDFKGTFGNSFLKWNTGDSKCEEHPLDQAACESEAAKAKGFIWNKEANNKAGACELGSSTPTLTAEEQKKKDECTGSVLEGVKKWDETKKSCDITPHSKETCSAMKKDGFVFVFTNNKCTEKTAKEFCEVDSKKAGHVAIFDSKAKKCNVKTEENYCKEDRKKEGFEWITPADGKPASCEMSAERKACTGEGKKEDGTVGTKTWNSESDPAKCDVLTAEETCGTKKLLGFIWDKDKKDCVQSPQKLACKEEKANDSGAITDIQKWNDTTGECDTLKVTDKDCREGYTWKDNKCAKNEPTTPACETEGQVYNKDTKQCEDSPEEKACWAKNGETDEESGERADKGYYWDTDSKSCKNNSKGKPGRGKKDNKPEDDGLPTFDFSNLPDKKAPARFTPVNIPSRQMYVLPGMP